MKELILIIFVIVIMQVLFLVPEDSGIFENARLSVSFGFLLVTAYSIGKFFSKFKLPKLVGYIFAGMLFGPHILNYFSAETIENMKIVNQLALTFIALNAGGELKLKELSEQKKRILWLLFYLILFIFCGMFIFTFLLKPYIPFVKERSLPEAFIISALLGTLSIARSPSSIIAIMQEYKAHGAFSETILGVTVAIDFIVIIIFAVVVSFGEAVLDPSTGMDAGFLIGVGIEVIVSVISGIVIGAGIAYYIKKVKVNVPILLVVLAFLIYSVSHAVSGQIRNTFDITFHLEPLLIAISAGFFIQNFTEGGPEFIESVESSSLPIYVLFFAMAGMVLRLDIMMEMIHIALALVLIRMCIAIISGLAAGKTAGAPKLDSRLYGLGFITQAGVSIGLAQEIIRRFPDWGVPLGTLIIAAINFNQLIGPITFKYALGKVGEIHLKK